MFVVSARQVVRTFSVRLAKLRLDLRASGFGLFKAIGKFSRTQSVCSLDMIADRGRVHFLHDAEV